MNRIKTASTTIALAYEYKWKVDWLLALDSQFSRIANLGCHIGYETLTLHWCLNAKETIGIDKDKGSIDQARSTMKYLRDDVEAVKRGLLYTQNLPEDDRESMKKFVQQFDNCSLPTFVAADFTQETEFLPNYFDLVFCERVLYHLACDDREFKTKELALAMHEIARITRPGGFVVAIEPKTCSQKNSTPIDLRPNFEQAGFNRVEGQKIAVDFEYKETYIYSKPI